MDRGAGEARARRRRAWTTTSACAAIAGAMLVALALRSPSARGRAATPPVAVSPAQLAPARVALRAPDIANAAREPAVAASPAAAGRRTSGPERASEARATPSAGTGRVHRAASRRLPRGAVVRGGCLAEPLDGCGVEVTVEATALDGRRRVREGPGRPTFDLSRADAWFETGTDFTLGPLPSGLPLRLTTRLGGLSVASLEIAPLAAGEERRVEMPKPELGAVRGRLLDERGAPLRDRWVGLFVAGDRPLGPARFGCEPGRFESVRGVRTDERGEFTMCGIPFGRWALAARLQEGWDFSAGRGNVGEVFDLDASLIELDLRLPRLVELYVTVRNADGTPAGSLLELEPEPFDVGGDWSLEPSMDEEPFVLAVRPLRHRIRARSWGLDTDWVEATPPAEVELRYPPTRRVVATLVEPTGRPVEVAVGVEHERGMRTVMPGVGMCENGGIVLERIPQEPVTLHLTAPGRIARRELPGGSGELDLGRIVMEPACEVLVRSARRDAPWVLAVDLGDRGVRLLREGRRITLPPEPIRAVAMRAHFAVSHDAWGTTYPGLTEPPDSAVRAALRSSAARTLDLRGRRRLSIDLDGLIPRGE